jgi:hypothetical protein
VLDLRNGATATVAHALAAIYIGVSLAFGHSMVRWADVRFAQRVAGGPPPEPVPRHGRPHAARERRGWVRHLLAWAIGAGLMLVGVAVVGQRADRRPPADGRRLDPDAGDRLRHLVLLHAVSARPGHQRLTVIRA